MAIKKAVGFVRPNKELRGNQSDVTKSRENVIESCRRRFSLAFVSSRVETATLFHSFSDAINLTDFFCMQEFK